MIYIKQILFLLLLNVASLVLASPTKTEPNSAQEYFELGKSFSDSNKRLHKRIAAAAYKKACDGGDMRGCTNLGDLHHEGHGVPYDVGLMKMLFMKACDGGDMLGCYNLGIVNSWGVRHSYKGVSLGRDLNANSLELFKKACHGGILRGCFPVGWAYENGNSVSRDELLAKEFFLKFCGTQNSLCTEQVERTGGPPIPDISFMISNLSH